MIFSPLNMYQYLMDTLPLNIVIYRPTVDGKDFIFMDINDRATQTDKVSKSEVIGKHLTEVFPNIKKFGLYDVLCRVCKTGNPEILEPTFYQDDRVQGWRRNEVRLLPNGDLLVIYEDYTEQKEIEKKLFSLGDIIDYSINEIYLFDKESLKFTYLNQGALKNIGYTIDELKQMTPLDIKPLHTHESFLTLLKALDNQSTKQLIIETVHRRKDGSTYDVEARMQMIKVDDTEEFVIFVSDITERKTVKLQLEHKIEELSKQTYLLEHYQQLVDKNSIVSITDENGLITHISEAFEKASGYSKEEVIGQTHALFRHPDTLKEFHTDMWNILKYAQEWEGEVKNRRKDGSAYWLRLHIEYNRDHMGNFIGYSSTGHDITHKIHLETLTKELENRITTEVEKNRLQTIQMLEQSRLAQMGEMISMIAHQWRQPLASIAAISSTLALDVMMDNYKKEFFEERLESIGDLSQHLSSTIDDFRGFFKENKEKEKATWEVITEGSLSIIEPTLLTHRINVERFYETHESLYTYVNEMRQVLLNIFKNAEDIFLEKKIDNATIRVRSYQKDSSLCLSIEDNGGGIPQELISKVFDPYFSTKEKKDGTGLGLYMSKTIIEEHCKGELTVRNTDTGALFEIVMPI